MAIGTVAPPIGAVELSTRQVVDSKLTVVDSGRQFDSQGSNLNHAHPRSVPLGPKVVG